MNTLKPAEIRIIERILRMGEGYVLDFSNRTFAEFFDREMDIDIDDGVWLANGTSKANRLRTYMRAVDDSKIAKLLRALDDYRTGTSFGTLNADSEMQAKFRDIIKRLSQDGSRIDETSPINTKALDHFSPDETLAELIGAIERDIQADKPQVALDRLHTYCMKRFGHLIGNYNPGAPLGDTLNARAGQYFNELKRQAKDFHPISFSIMKSAVLIFDQFNDVRNNRSLAHDNRLVSKSEARFVFESVCNILRFIKSTEGQNFGA